MVGLYGAGTHIRTDFGETCIEASGAGEDRVVGWRTTMAGRSFQLLSELTLMEDLFWLWLTVGLSIVFSPARYAV